jgi:hypothetical protein
MLRLTWFEFFVRAIPEQFLFVLAIHAFSKIRIDLKKYLLSGMLAAIMLYLIRLLPIQYGVHSLVSLIILIVIVSYINKIDIIKSIRSGIVSFILCFILEGINVVFIQFVLKMDLNSIMNNHILKTITGLPSLIVFGIVVIAYYYRLSKREELQYA